MEADVEGFSTGGHFERDVVSGPTLGGEVGIFEGVFGSEFAVVVSGFECEFGVVAGDLVDVEFGYEDLVAANGDFTGGKVVVAVDGVVGVVVSVSEAAVVLGINGFGGVGV